MAENTPAIAAETPVSYKRFAESDKISQGTTNAALSLNDYLPGQHVTGPNNNDIAATLAQIQAIPIGTATLSGNTYNVTISNYPNTATIYPGQKISVKFNADAPTADDTALNLSAFGQSLPLCARGVRMGQGAIKSGMILELVYRGDMWNADYGVVKSDRDANGYTTFADGQSGYSRSQVNNALANLSPLTMQHSEDANSCIPTNSNNVQTFILPTGSANCPVTPCSITTYKRNTDRYEQVCFPNGIKNNPYYRYGAKNGNTYTWEQWNKIVNNTDLDSTDPKANLGNKTVSDVLSYLKDRADVEGFVLRIGLFYNLDNGIWTKYNAVLYKASDTRYIGSVEMYETRSTRVTRWRSDNTTWTVQTIVS